MVVARPAVDPLRAAEARKGATSTATSPRSAPDRAGPARPPNAVTAPDAPSTTSRLATSAPQWLAAHWGHQTVAGEFNLAHLASQLYAVGEMLRSRLGSIDGARVLDAGASDGFFLSYLGAASAVGVNFLADCAKKIRTDGYSACVADVERLPFADRSFDYVICCETLEHLPNPIHAIDELARVCRKRLIVTIPWLPETRVTRRPAGWPAVESHIFEFSEQDFERVLSHARVRMTYRDRVQVFPEPRNPVMQWWFERWMYPNFFPKLQYYELEPV